MRCPVPKKIWSPFHWPQYSDQQNVWWKLFLVAWNQPTCSSVKWEVLPFFRRSFWDATCRAQQGAGSKCIWERLDWNQITSCTFTSKYWRTFMSHPGIWFSSQQHWSVPRNVTLWQKILVTSPVTFPLTVLMTSEEYSGSLEADMSENHPTSSSVKWEALLSLCVILSWMRSAGHSHVQVARFHGKGCIETRSQAAPWPAGMSWCLTHGTDLSRHTHSSLEGRTY